MWWQIWDEPSWYTHRIFHQKTKFSRPKKAFGDDFGICLNKVLAMYLHQQGVSELPRIFFSQFHTFLLLVEFPNRSLFVQNCGLITQYWQRKEFLLCPVLLRKNTRKNISFGALNRLGYRRGSGVMIYSLILCAFSCHAGLMEVSWLNWYSRDGTGSLLS